MDHPWSCDELYEYIDWPSPIGEDGQLQHERDPASDSRPDSTSFLTFPFDSPWPYDATQEVAGSYTASAVLLVGATTSNVDLDFGPTRLHFQPPSLSFLPSSSPSLHEFPYGIESGNSGADAPPVASESNQPGRFAFSQSTIRSAPQTSNISDDQSLSLSGDQSLSGPLTSQSLHSTDQVAQLSSDHPPPPPIFPGQMSGVFHASSSIGAQASRSQRFLCPGQCGKPNCTRSFSRKDSLKAHMAPSVREKCANCPKVILKKNMTRHIAGACTGLAGKAPTGISLHPPFLL